MKSNVVKVWFGESFKYLHPKLQELHTKNSTLAGSVDISFGRGLAGIMGKRLARKMGVPLSSQSHLTVSISHSDSALLWSRNFAGKTRFISSFEPVGNIENGYWLENSGNMTLKLSVEIINGGWHWRYLQTKLFGIPLPKFLTPKVQASKCFEDGKYHFQVIPIRINI